MRPLLLTAALLFFALTLTACHSHPCTKCKAKMDGKPLLRHVVAFKFKESATEKQVDEIVHDFAELPSKIDSIVGFEHGTNVSTEKFDQGYTHVFIVTFEDQEGLKKYLPHPAHKAFVEKLMKVLAPPPFVVDYYAE